MKRLSLAIVRTVRVRSVRTTLFAADTFDLTIPLPLTGKQAKFGEIMKRSYEMAAEEINAKGGIKGKKIALSFEDSTGKPETARAIVEKLIDVEEAAHHRRRVHLGLRKGRCRRGRGAQDPLPRRGKRRRRHHADRTTSTFSARTR